MKSLNLGAVLLHFFGSLFPDAAHDRHREMHGLGETNQRFRVVHFGDGCCCTDWQSDCGRPERAHGEIPNALFMVWYVDHYGWLLLDGSAVGSCLGN